MLTDPAGMKDRSPMWRKDSFLPIVLAQRGNKAAIRTVSPISTRAVNLRLSEGGPMSEQSRTREWHPRNRLGKGEVGRMRVSVVSEHLLPAELVATALREEEEIEVASVVGGTASLESQTGARALRERIMTFVAMAPPEFGLLRRVIEDAGAAARILVIADQCGAVGLARALQLGARGYVGPWESVEMLAPRILRAGRGDLAVPPGPADELRVAMRVLAREATAVRRLSETDLDVMRWLSRGETAKEIAVRLNVSEPAVRHRIRRIMARLEVRNEKELSAVAATAGLYEPRRPAAA
jgi:DNA-binding NarL/FixJ family response regulator